MTDKEDQISIKEMEKINLKVVKALTKAKCRNNEVAASIPFLIFNVAVGSKLSDKQFDETLDTIIHATRILWSNQNGV